MPPFLHIATISNDLTAYRAMRVSMTAAGFTADRCRFTLFDNSQANQHEPFGVLRGLATNGEEPFIVLCHQDLLFDQNSSFDVLQKQIERLHAVYPAWAVAGTAGVDLRGTPTLYMDDPYGSHRAKNLPRKVISLDENFLLLRRDNYVMPTPSLKGFHFYGTDLCLNAFIQKKSAYVIEFPVRHLSAGQSQSEAYSALKEQMIRVWRPRLLIGLVQCMPSEFRVSRWRWLERILQRRYPVGLLRRLRLPLLAARTGAT